MAANEALDFDDVLIALAKKIPDDTMNELGKKLGFDAVAIERYIATNSRYQNVTSNGTLAMLRDWDNKQTKATEQAALKKALMDAGLVRLADEFFPISGRGDNSSMMPSSTVIQGTHFNRMDRIVTDKELRKLAGCLPADSFVDVAIHLGLEYTDYDNIKLQNQSSFKDANFKMLMKWKTDKGGKVGVLDEALKEAQCGGLAYKD